jgi:DNA-binding HxlR family transcriptional regulator
VRSGAQTLILLAAPLNVLILRALADGPGQQAELRRATGSPAQTTLRAQLKKLVEIGAIDKHRRNRFPGVLEYELTREGRDLLFVADTLERWLERATDAPLSLESGAAKSATKALTDAWSSAMLRALAATPLSLTDLDGVIGSLSYPALERRLAAMRLAGLIETRSSNGRGRPYGVTEWLRRGIAPLAAAARWERRHLPRQTPPVSRLDVEAAFLLTVPLLRLPAELSGACRMAAEISNGDNRRLAGVTIDVQGGRISSCATQLKAGADAWALGSPAAWLDALIERDLDRLELGGDCSLARDAVDGLHGALFGPSGARSANGSRS